MLEINISIGFTFCLLSSRHLKQWIHGFNAFGPELVQHTRIQLWAYSLSRVILAKFTHKTSKLIAGWLCIDICFNINNKEHFPLICFLTITLLHTFTLHTYFYSLYSRLGDLGHLGLGDGRLVLIQWVQLKNEMRTEDIFCHKCSIASSKQKDHPLSSVVQSLLQNLNFGYVCVQRATNFIMRQH